MKVVARFTIGGEDRETREVDDAWLQDAWDRHDNVLLRDGNTYRISDVRFSDDGGSRCAHVELAAPTFARGS